ncbi:MAG TPA: hypothetical protein VI229_06525 [Burkholderiales bacterium]
MILERFIDTGRKFLPDGLTLIGGFDFLPAAEQRFVSQVQGRTYAGMFGALLTHQSVFRRLDATMAACMPAGYRLVPDPGVVDAVVRSRSAWSVLALTCLIDLLGLAHYRQSIRADEQMEPLWQDALLRHWKELQQCGSQNEVEWKREDARLEVAARDRAVGDLIVLVGTLDGILQAQALADARYFALACGRPVNDGEQARVGAALLNAYRWQYILSGVQLPHFSALLTGMLSAGQHGRIAAALAPLFDPASAPHVRWAA